MSDERLDRIEATQDRLIAGQAKLEAGQAKLEAGQAKLETGQAKLEAGQAQLEAGQEKLGADVAALGREMRVLHEDVVDRIRALADPGEILRREIRAGDTRVYESLDQRVQPLELTVREHSQDIARLKKRRR
jgi:hypothetical protein